MRGAYYVVTALLVVASCRTAAESGQHVRPQTLNHDGKAASTTVHTALPKRILRGSSDILNELAHTAADEERVLGVPMVDLKRRFAALRAALTKVFEILGLKAQHNPPVNSAVIVDASENQFRYKGIISLVHKCAEDMNWHLYETNENPILQAGEPSTPRKRDHFPSLAKTMKRRGHNPGHTHNRALPPEPVVHPIPLYKLFDETKVKAIHEAFLGGLSSSIFKPTFEETLRLLSLLNWPQKGQAGISLREIAIESAIQELTTVLENDPVVSRQWPDIADSQKFKMVNHMLIANYQRWKSMYDTFSTKWPEIHYNTLQNRNFQSDFGTNTQPNLYNIGQSNHLAPPVHNIKIESHLVEPTSPKLVTKDFLSNFGQGTQP